VAKPATTRTKAARAAETSAEEKPAAKPRSRKTADSAPPAEGRKADPPVRAGSLAAYQAKRDFGATSEPAGEVTPTEGFRFCVQKHDATRLHFDLRLELDGVLKSWAVTRGPSFVTSEKRLAVETEDHPLEYLTFEGVIPKGQYGAGTMIVWDTGTWRPEFDPHLGLDKGHLEFTLEGERLRGRWHLVKMKPRPREKRNNWLLIKADDEYAHAEGTPEPVDLEMGSVLSGTTNAELEKTGAVRADHAGRAAATKPRALPDLARAKGAKKGIMPPFVEPCLASLADRAPNGPDWVHEIKFDGYRLQARIDGAKVKLLTRKGLDWSDKFAAVGKALAALGLGAAILDGEVVVEEGGVSNFAALQAALEAGTSASMVYYVFDLLYLAGFNLTGMPLAERKALLAGLLDDVPKDGPIRFSEHIEGEGEAMARHACRLGLEGIVSKRRDLPYRSGRGNQWLKVKCALRQDFVVAGYVPSTTSKKAVGSLVLGVNEGGRLVHVGRVGTGFSEAVSRSIAAELDAIARPTPPFDGSLTTEARKGVRWAEPRLVAEVEFRTWTADGNVRHAAFKGLRRDLDPAEIVREGGAMTEPEDAPAPARSFALTHPDRVLWPDIGLTKQGLAEFYAATADFILPHIVNRPLALVRCPQGVGQDCFFQKHAFAGMSKAVARHTVGDEEVLVVSDFEGLVALVQASVLEIHPWGSTMADPELPDRITFDLDPDEGLAYADVIAAALDVRARLDAMGLASFVKTTGGKGLHVVVPLEPKADWDAVKTFAAGVASTMAKENPAKYTDNVSKRARTGRLYVDYLRNGRGATAVAAYSTRARAGAPVATPLGWDELTPDIKPNHFTVANLPGRLATLTPDPWAGMSELRQVLPGTAKRRKAK